MTAGNGLDIREKVDAIDGRLTGGTAPQSVTLTTANVPTGVGLVQVWNRNTSTLAVLF